jgi:hypothetical protein
MEAIAEKSPLLELRRRNEKKQAEGSVKMQDLGSVKKNNLTIYQQTFENSSKSSESQIEIVKLFLDKPLVKTAASRFMI